jgi:hypothetical protein
MNLGLPLLHLGFLYADNVCGGNSEKIIESFVDTGP